MLLILILVYSYFVAVNAAAFAAIGWDKRCAQCGARRVPESLLLTFAASGGWLGTKAGQKVFRHKTRKEWFVSLLSAIPFLHFTMASVAVLGFAASTA
ncbi:MAG: DUF1294 domain-containing protein [Pseudomonadota bacterium]